MDPHENLREQLELAEKVIESDSIDEDDVRRMAELVESLDEWMKKGGFSPWKGKGD